jgi:hypothetical protein
MFEGFRRWLDGEELIEADGQPKPRSKWEDFMVAIAREVEAVMQREMFTPPGGPTYIPREYVIGQFRVQPVWDKDADRTMVKPRRGVVEDTLEAGSQQDEDSTVVRPRTRPEAPAAAPLYTISVERALPGPAAPPDVRKFFKPKITIGRGSKQKAVDLRLEGDLEISRQHATLEQQGGTFLVTCEGRNSIFVDSTEVLTGETAAVRPGQRISICSYVLTPQAVLAETVIYDNAQ